MKLIIKFSFIVLFLPLNLWARGGSVGNGGGAWVCRDSNLKIKWARLIDFYEAENEFGLKISTSSSKTVDEYLDDVSRKAWAFNQQFYYALTKTLSNIKANLKFVSASKLTVIDDSLFRISPSPETCSFGTVNYEQLANFTEFEMILVQPQIYQALSSIEQAGLLVHEAIYKLQRERKGATNSVDTRRIVGLLFSSLDPSKYASDLDGYSLVDRSKSCDLCIDFDVELRPEGNFSEGLVVFEKNGKYGYMDRDGQVKIQPQFYGAREFHEGFAAVQYTPTIGMFLPNPIDGYGFWGVIDKNGQFVFKSECRFAPSDFSGGLAKVSGCAQDVNGYYPEGLIDQNGKFAVPLQYAEIGNVSDGILKIYDRATKRCSYYNTKIDLLFTKENVISCSNFSEGLAVVKVKESSSEYVDNAGNVVLSVPYAKASEFKNGLAAVANISATGFAAEEVSYIDKTGNIAITPQIYSYYSDVRRGLILVKEVESRFFQILDLEGKVLIQKVLSWGGEVPKNASLELIPIEFSNSQWGYVDRYGRIVIEPQFERAGYFVDGLASTDRGYLSMDMIKLPN